MRLKKASLVAAALSIVASTALFADVVNNEYYTSGGAYGNNITDLSGRGVIIVDTATLTLDIQHATTFSGVILSSNFGLPGAPGTGGGVNLLLVKTGDGTLQYDGFKHFTSSNVGPDGFEITENYFRNHIWVGESPRPSPEYRDLSQLPTTIDLRGYARAYDGAIVIEGGTLQVSGYINQWVQYPAQLGTGFYFSGEMVGAGTTVLQGTGKLSFQNTDLNVVNAKASLGHTDAGPFAPLTKRYNFVKNLQTGTELVAGYQGPHPDLSYSYTPGIYSNDQLQTELLVGENATGLSQYRIIVHIEDINTGTDLNNGLDGSVGIIRGNIGGRFYKTGEGDFAILNRAQFAGDIFLAGGNTILKNADAADGRTLAEVNSVNLVGTDGLQGNYIIAATDTHRDNGALHTVWKPAYAPAQETDDAIAQLTIEGNQTIKNLQVLFSEGAAATDPGLTVSSAIRNAAENLNGDEPFIAGIGKGTNIQIGANTLTIDQQYDGYYGGNINQDSLTAEGSVIKKGTGTLALLLESSGKFNSITVEAGVLVANVQGLGYGTVIAAGGILDIVQSDAGTLHAILAGNESSTITINTHAYITNMGGNQIRVGAGLNEGNIGTVQVFEAQHAFEGTLVVNDGATLLLGNNGTDGANDIFKNAKAIYLMTGETGRGSTLDIADVDAIVHNLQGDAAARIRLGRGTLTLASASAGVFLGEISGEGSFIKTGEGSLALTGKNIFSGAIAATEGVLSFVNPNAIKNASALIIKNGATVMTNGTDQAVGALFGEKGAILDIGGSTLTVGFSDAVRASLAHNSNLLNAGYLATYTNDIKAHGDIYSDAIETTATDGTTVGYLKSTPIDLNNAADLAYEGEIIGTGTIVKIGTERLTLSGISNKFTGTVEVNGGILRLNENSLPNVARININTNSSSNADFLEYYVEAGKSTAISSNISGVGSLHKVGMGQLILTDYTYEGKTAVDAGRLVVGDISHLSIGAKEITVNDSGTLVVNYSGDSASVFEGSIKGTGGLEKLGDGTVIITETAAYGHIENNLVGENLVGFNRLADTVNHSVTLNGDGTAVTFADATYDAISGTVTLQNGATLSAENLEDIATVERQVYTSINDTAVTDNGNDTYILGDGTTIFDPGNAPGNLSGISITDNGNGTYTLTATRTDIHNDIVGAPVGIAIRNTDGSITLLSEEATVGATTVDLGATLRKNGTLVKSDGSRQNLHAVVVDATGGAIYLDGVEVNADYLTLNDNQTTLAGESNGVIIVGPDGLSREVSNGSTLVLGGALILNDLPQYIDANTGITYYGDFEIAKDATLSVEIDTADRILHGDLIGEGTFIKTGENRLIFDAQKNDFTGVLFVENGTVSFADEEVLQNAASIELRNDSVLELNGNKQTLHYLKGDETSTILLSGADVYFVVDGSAGETEEYSGRINGPGNIYKQGTGILTLWRPYDAGNQFLATDGFYVQKGVLQVAPAALGDATVEVLTDAELRFYAKDTDGDLIDGRNTVEYENSISGGGIVGKGGNGTVWLKGAGSIPAGDGTRQFTVTEGRLIVDDARTGGSIPLVEVAQNATFQVNLSSAGPVLLSQQTVFGDGNFSIKATAGATTVTVDTSPLGYNGLTEVIGGITLNFDATGLAAGEHFILNGISGLTSGTGTPTLDLAGVELLEINQIANAVFEGNVVGDGNSSILLNGTGALALTGNSGVIDSSIANVTVVGATLQVGVSNTHAVTVNNGGTLAINTTGGGQTYAGTIENDTGTFNITKNGTGTLVIDSSITSILPDHKRIETLAVTGGTLKLIAGTGNISENIPANHLVAELADNDDVDSTILEFDIATGQARLNLSLSGNGTVDKTGNGALTFTNQLDFTGLLRVSEGELNGAFRTGGDLTIASGATLSPGNSIGTISVTGNFIAETGSILNIELSNAQDIAFDSRNDVSVSDRIIYNANGTAPATIAADIDGSILSLSGANGSTPQRGAKYAIVVDGGAKAANGVANITGAFDTDPDSNVHFVTILPQDNADESNPYHGLGLNYGATILVTQEYLADVVGYKPHKGLEEFLPIMDDFSHASTDSAMITDPAARLGALLNATGTRNLSGAINNLSPLGYSSLIAMTAATANSTVEQLESRMEQRRYDRTLYSNKSWQTYFIGSTNFANNGNNTSSAIYNFNTYGGIVGADNQVSEDNLLGVALEYAHGQASMHAGGGKMKMDSLRATGYISRQITPWYFVDAGVSGGYMDYTVKRETLSGINEAKPEGWSVGTFAYLNSVLPLDHAKTVHLKPFAGFEFNHYGISTRAETGSISRLNVNDFNMDSLRGKIGTGLAWFVDRGDWVWKFNLDVAYVHEFMDTSAKIDSAFIAAGNGTDFSVNAKAFARDVFQVGPSVTISLTENCSLYANYRLELGIDGETYNNINFGFRSRF